MMKRMLIVLVCFGLVFSSSGASLAAEEKVLNVYNWTDYLPDEIIKAFTKETGIKVLGDAQGGAVESLTYLRVIGRYR
jgi:spermidine/putrescine-binding protein